MLFLHLELGNPIDHLFTLGTERIDEISAGTVGEATAIEFMDTFRMDLMKSEHKDSR